MRQKELLLLKANDIARYTNISGNIDTDRLTPHILNAQRTQIKRILGTELYNKILSDFENNSLSGKYEEIYEDFVVDMLVNYAAYFIVLFNGLRVENAGNLYNQPDNASSAEIEDSEKVANRYKQIAASVELEFTKWIKQNSIPEYPNSGTCTSSSNTFQLQWLL